MIPTLVLAATAALSLELAPADDSSRALAEGDACAPGTYDFETSPDSRTLRVRLYDAGVLAGFGAPGGRGFDGRTCRLPLTARVPAGWSFALEAVDLEASASLTDQNATGTVESAYLLEFARNPAYLLRRSFRGYYDGGFSFNGRVTPSEAQWSSCDGFSDKRLELYTRLTVRAGTGRTTAEVRGRDFDGAVTQHYAIAWRPCGGNPPPPGGGWRGSCRVVHETIWGQDLRDFWGTGRGSTRQAATNAARADGASQCEAVRRGDSLTRCVVDNGACDAT